MRDLIEVLNIFLKYFPDDVRWPTHCEHDELTFGLDISPDRMSKEDIERLDELGVFWSEEDDCFKSFRYGRC